ncbi:hypothetical protein [uncultured Aquimarina sp.]|uniref:hypothetical protein n=1 Tax=uncultured Aquimarina sp. TaxID=575652 RepID=UPI00261E0CCB|nr:hypothetical protein [uncultured Aquimarina sp.]
MDFTVIRLLLDFGLLILIWIVQLIIYPSFEHFQKQDLMKWHSVYTVRIGVVVMPLMIGQLLINVIFVYKSFSIYTLISLILVVVVWLSTFLQFVPMHSYISDGNFDSKLINRLINLNWLRTFLWTTVFLYSLLLYFVSV